MKQRKHHGVKVSDYISARDNKSGAECEGYKTPLSRQIGGSHYKDFPIQPVEFITKNKLNFLQGCIVKRITRYNLPGGKGLQDLEKIIHEAELLIEIEGWRKK